MGKKLDNTKSAVAAAAAPKQPKAKKDKAAVAAPILNDGPADGGVAKPSGRTRKLKPGQRALRERRQLLDPRYAGAQEYMPVGRQKTMAKQAIEAVIASRSSSSASSSKFMVASKAAKILNFATHARMIRIFRSARRLALARGITNPQERDMAAAVELEKHEGRIARSFVFSPKTLAEIAKREASKEAAALKKKEAAAKNK